MPKKSRGYNPTTGYQSNSSYSSILSSMPTQKANKLDIFSILPSAVKQDNIIKAKRELSDKAKLMVPDSGALSEALLERDIYSGHREPLESSLNMLGGNYLKQYSENPYYAFTKEGRSLAKQMQSIVSQPILSKMEEIKLKEDEIMGRVNSAGMEANPLVKDNKVFVNRGGQSVWVGLDNIQDNDRVYSIADAHKLVESGALMKAIDYDMSSYDDVWTKLNNVASGLGTTQTKDLFGTTKKGQSWQASQRKQWMKDQNLTSQDWNTLTSEYIKQHKGVGSREDVVNWVMNGIDNRLNSSMSSTTNYDVEAAGKVDANGRLLDSKNLNAEIGALQLGIRGYDKLTTVANYDEKAIKGIWEEEGTKIRAIQKVNTTMFGDYKKTLLDADGKTTNTSAGLTNLNDNDVFKALTDGYTTVTTPDGESIAEYMDSTVPDITRESIIVEEGGIMYMYMPVLMSNATWRTPDLFEDNDFIGTYDNDTKSYTKDKVGKLSKSEISSNPLVKNYSKAMDTEGNDWVSSTSFAQNVYQSTVKFKLKKDYETSLRQLDNNPVYTTKVAQVEPMLQDATSGKVNNTNVRGSLILK